MRSIEGRRDGKTGYDREEFGAATFFSHLCSTHCGTRAGSGYHVRELSSLVVKDS